MLLYVWQQESCTKVIPINVLSPQHGYLQPSRSKIAQSKRCTSLEETRNTHLVTRARIEKRVQERLCRKFRIEPRIGDAPVFPFCRIFFTCATSLLFPARQLHRVLCRVTVARRTRTGHSRRGYGFVSPGASRKFHEPGYSLSAFHRPLCTLRFSRKGIVDIFFSRHPRERERSLFFLFFLFSAISRHHERLLPLTRSCLSANLFRFLCTSHRFGKFHGAFDRSNQRLVSIRGQRNGMEFV